MWAEALAGANVSSEERSHMLEDEWADGTRKELEEGEEMWRGKKGWRVEDIGCRKEGDPTGAGGRKEERRVSESATPHFAVTRKLHKKKSVIYTPQRVNEVLELSPAGGTMNARQSVQLLQRAAVRSDVRPSSLQSICQSFALHSDTRVLHYATLHSAM